METNKTNEKKSFMGMIEMNENQETDVNGGINIPIFMPCCGLAILTDFVTNSAMWW